MRLVVISNRLPVTVEGGENEVSFRQSTGGLVQGLSASLDSLKDYTKEAEYVWVGWPGTNIKEELQEKVRKELQKNFRALPIFIDENEMTGFYLGFCNSTIWPLFHMIPSFATYSDKYFEDYVNVNKKFADTVSNILRDDDIVWIHDYHLMLLPQLLREKKDVPIGFFLHIPFPPFEIYRLLPKQWRASILKGVLGSDVIGFHTYTYMQNFIRTCEKTLGIESEFGKFKVENRIISVGVFPISIDFEKYNRATENKSVKQEFENLKNTFKNEKVILSIDRLDYTKGVVNRLHAYEQFLEKNPGWHRKVCLVMILVPSRIGVYKYQETKNDIDQLVGSINGKFGAIDWTPIIYQFKNLPFESLTALYAKGDIILVTPIIDGMNLVSKEYIASHRDLNGVLILSECAGSAEELKKAIIVSPNDISEVADAIKRALEMTIEEKKSINKSLQDYLSKYDVKWWAGSFINKLMESHKEKIELEKKKDVNEIKSDMIKDYSMAQKRLFLLDYDGTLVNFSPKPELAKPPSNLVKILERLSKNTKNDVVILTGRDRETIGGWFRNPDIQIFAEHGAYLRQKGEKWIRMLPVENGWKEEIAHIIKIYESRIPASFTEMKDFSVVFHFRNAPEEVVQQEIPELYDVLKTLTSNTGIVVRKINKGIEVKSAMADKSIASLYFLREPYDFIFAAGDDSIDEGIFKSLPKRDVYSIKVGDGFTYANYRAKNPEEISLALKELSSIEYPKKPFWRRLVEIIKR